MSCCSCFCAMFVFVPCCFLLFAPCCSLLLTPCWFYSRALLALPTCCSCSCALLVIVRCCSHSYTLLFAPIALLSLPCHHALLFAIFKCFLPPAPCLLLFRCFDVRSCASLFYLVSWYSLLTFLCRWRNLEQHQQASSKNKGFFFPLIFQVFFLWFLFCLFVLFLFVIFVLSWIIFF
jgi:hypothetical protein